MVKFVRSVHAVRYKDSATVGVQGPNKFTSKPTHLDFNAGSSMQTGIAKEKCIAWCSKFLASKIWIRIRTVIIYANPDRDPAPDSSINTQKEI